MITFKQAFVQWQRAFDAYADAVQTDAAKETYAEVNRAWIDLVLDDLAGWRDLRIAAVRSASGGSGRSARPASRSPCDPAERCEGARRRSRRAAARLRADQ